jgi:hypothetical protein
VPTFADRGCRVISATHPYGCYLDFLDPIYGSTKNDVGISGSYNSGMKINMKELFAVFIIN